MKFGTYNRLHLYFQFGETTWCLIGFYGNNSQINVVTGGRHRPGFLNFQIFFIFELSTKNGEKTLFSDSNIQNCKIHCEVVSIYAKIVAF